MQYSFKFQDESFNFGENRDLFMCALTIMQFNSDIDNRASAKLRAASKELMSAIKANDFDLATKTITRKLYICLHPDHFTSEMAQKITTDLSGYPDIKQIISQEKSKQEQHTILATICVRGLEYLKLELNKTPDKITAEIKQFLKFIQSFTDSDAHTFTLDITAEPAAPTAPEAPRQPARTKEEVRRQTQARAEAEAQRQYQALLKQIKAEQALIFAAAYVDYYKLSSSDITTEMRRSVNQDFEQWFRVSKLYESTVEEIYGSAKRWIKAQHDHEVRQQAAQAILEAFLQPQNINLQYSHNFINRYR